MATIDNKRAIDELIAADGYFEGDPRVVLIVEYETLEGRTVWGIVYETERPVDRLRYFIETEYVHNPRCIWIAR